MKQVLFDIQRERQRQEQKWGKQTHSELFWQSILLEEVGEAAMEINNRINKETMPIGSDHLREELIQIAAVAVAWVEDLDERIRRLT